VHDEQLIIAATLDKLPAGLGVMHWPAQLLADQLGVSVATVARIRRHWGLKPWKAETFMFSTDPSTIKESHIPGSSSSNSSKRPVHRSIARSKASYLVLIVPSIQ
jgi:DNA-binding MurR/RpiR family transcriptional regulator